MKRNPLIKCLQSSRLFLRVNPVVRRVANVSRGFTKLHMRRLGILLHARHIAARTRTLSRLAATHALVPPTGTGGLLWADVRARTIGVSHLRATSILGFPQLGKTECLVVDIE